MDYTTLLPPRKRLLCGLKTQNCGRSCSSPPRSDDANDLSSRINQLRQLSDVSLEKVIEASKLTASASASAAAVARTVALEKAAAAVKAKVFARSVLELVGSCCRDEVCGETRKRGRKKCVMVEHLYKSDSAPLEDPEDDEELARRLHHVMNSSPRISRRRKFRNDGSTETEKDPVTKEMCEVNSTSLCDGNAFPSKGESASKAQLKDLPRPRCVSIEKNGGSSSQTKNESGRRTRIMLDDRPGMAKQKKMLLSQCCDGDGKDFGAAQGSNGHALSSNQKKIMFRATKIYCNGSILPVEVDSTKKCKKLKLSQLYSEK